MKTSFNIELFKKSFKKEFSKGFTSLRNNLTEEIEELAVLITGKKPKDNYTFREMMSWFIGMKKKYPEAAKGGAILRKKVPNENIIFLFLIDKNNELFDDNDNLTSIRITACRIDNDIVELFDNKELIIIE